ncbi:serine/threonine-protein kinase [Paenibacillus physcomitrellae]|uniref:non-specific serine/threonine protein kinase n=1 Tax=Paenibacillus physcomitrellae TaxID=1619311 RepID=A0ABQ1FPC7_9BACL|nr:serine/threonine-protein kinase [Paenibacillus physcomitrellae]GGA24977.1 hypothetical protein GCM10010917_07330 [Paenibacillus physcomitrellae]
MAPIPELLENGTLLANRYRIVRHTGSGGASHVYVASDLKLPGKLWAVKQTLADPAGTGRMEEETGMLIALNHPRLPRIVDFFQTDEGNEEDREIEERGKGLEVRTAGRAAERSSGNRSGYMYLVMDYIVGTTLEEHIRKGNPVREEELLHIADQICDGLHYLHTREPPIIYRDLKPSNLMVEHGREIRFIDFGTARAYNPQLNEDTIQLGTVGFAAPEQYLGKQSDARTDLYALGAILLYMASQGRYTQWPKDIKTFDWKGLSPGLAQLIRKLLSYEPAERIQTALEAKQELRKLQPSYISGRAGGEPGDRPVLVAITGASTGLGTTHLAFALANSLSRFYTRVSYVEWNERSSAVAGLQSYWSDSGFTGRHLEHGRVAYYKKPSRTEWLRLLGSGQGLILMDMGTQMTKDSLEEFARADLQIVVIPAGSWRRSEISSCNQRLSAFTGRKRVYVSPLADAHVTHRLAKMLKDSKVYSFPMEPDPFHLGEHTVQAAERICETLLPKRSRTSQWKTGKWRPGKWKARWLNLNTRE